MRVWKFRCQELALRRNWERSPMCHNNQICRILLTTSLYVHECRHYSQILPGRCEFAKSVPNHIITYEQHDIDFSIVVVKQVLAI